MAPPAPPPSRVFAELDLAPAPAPAPAPEGRVEPAALPGREVHVSGSAELSARPDRARVSLRLGSRKEAAVAARSSVCRRLQYIAQSARLHGVPDLLVLCAAIMLTNVAAVDAEVSLVEQPFSREENMTVTEDFSRVENTYQMEAEMLPDDTDWHIWFWDSVSEQTNNSELSFTYSPSFPLLLARSCSLIWEQMRDLLRPQLQSTWILVCSVQLCHQLALSKVKVCIIFSDFGKMQNVCNLLIEKLGTSVTISPPHFYHTPEAIDTLRRQVCVTAVGNTRRKAQEVCQLFGQALGKPLLIKEEETKEWGGHIDSHLSLSADSQTLQERIQNATAYASCRVFAVFEIKGKENRRNKLP